MTYLSLLVPVRVHHWQCATSQIDVAAVRENLAAPIAVFLQKKHLDQLSLPRRRNPLITTSKPRKAPIHGDDSGRGSYLMTWAGIGISIS